MSVPELGTLFLRMALATLLGACVAYRIWRPLMPFTSPPSTQGAQTQTLIAAAGALMVVVIGDNVARAFGLVGLGSFIRFRSGISDPRDAAVMFVMIGIGMACGLGMSVMAIAGTGFVCLLLIGFDVTGKGRSKRTIVTINADDPPLIWPQISQLFKNMRVVEMSRQRVELGKDSGKLVVELDLRGNMDAATIREILETNKVPGVSRVALGE
ncbi:MAG TPA: DUF4956 domain-containing protein [Polyangiaceae bacterium]|nr:DUF4956 domain-containing protein [Polyangiaceae bacterium]